MDIFEKCFAAKLSFIGAAALAPAFMRGLAKISLKGDFCLGEFVSGSPPPLRGTPLASAGGKATFRR